MESGGGICGAALLGACGLLRRRRLRSGRLFQGRDTPLAGASAWRAVSGFIRRADRRCVIPAARAVFHAGHNRLRRSLAGGGEKSRCRDRRGCRFASARLIREVFRPVALPGRGPADGGRFVHHGVGFTLQVRLLPDGDSRGRRHGAFGGRERDALQASGASNQRRADRSWRRIIREPFSVHRARPGAFDRHLERDGHCGHAGRRGNVSGAVDRLGYPGERR